MKFAGSSRANLLSATARACQHLRRTQPRARQPPAPRASSPPTAPGARRASIAPEARRPPAPPACATSHAPDVQTLRKPRQPAARTASTTYPARPAAPAPRQRRPATHAPRHTSAPVTDLDPSCRPQGLPKDVLRGLSAAPQVIYHYTSRLFTHSLARSLPGPVPPPEPTPPAQVL